MNNNVSLILGFLAIGLCCGLHLLALGGAGVLAGILTGKVLLTLSAAVVLVGAYMYARWRKRRFRLHSPTDKRIQESADAFKFRHPCV
jgi:membrane protein implicated in regulation of membrane protease activity